MSEVKYYISVDKAMIVRAPSSIPIPSRTKSRLEDVYYPENEREWEKFFKNTKIEDESVYRTEDIKRAISILNLESGRAGGKKRQKRRVMVLLSKSPDGVLIFTASTGEGAERQVTEVAVSPVIRRR